MNAKENNKRWNNQKLNIGTYYLAPYARTEEHIKDAAACGIDFFVNIPNDSVTLTLLHKYQIGAIVTNVLPNWFGGDGSNAGQLESTNPIEKYQDALKEFTDAPNILGIDTGDEPSLLDFPYYGKIFDVVHQKYPFLEPYLNIYPNYALKGSNTKEEIFQQLGSDQYSTYIETYCKNVISDYICFDYYLYSASLEGLYQTLITVSDACKKYHRDLWMVLQVNSNQPDVWINTKQLQFQAFTAMAFGAKSIIWACYTAGWWHNHVLDKEGNKTEQYEKLKNVNSHIHFLGAKYLQFSHKKTYFVGNHPVSAAYAKLSLTNSFVKDFRAENNEALLIGEMESENGQKALFLCASNDSNGLSSLAFDISFYTKNYQVDLFYNHTKKTLVPSEDGIYTFTISPTEGALLCFL